MLIILGLTFTTTTHHDTYPAINPLNFNLKGRYVFITGASKGIGRSTALSFALAGASGLALAARSPVTSLVTEIEEVTKSHNLPLPKIVTVELDVTSEPSVQDAARKVKEEFPYVDILINNAGYLEKRKKIGESDTSEWWKTWEVNVKGPYLVTHYFLPLVLLSPKSTSRLVINLSSIAAHLLSPGGSAYQTSKLAVQRFTEFLDVDHGVDTNDGVLTFGIHPGGVLTEMGKRLPEERHAALTETTALCADALVFWTAQRREWLAGRYLSACWDVEEIVGREKEIVDGDKLKVRMRV